MLLYIIRHGVTEWNRLKKVQGCADIPLAKEGRALAEKTGRALSEVKFDICYTSPLMRARQTAELVLGKRDVPIVCDARIREIDFGVLEGTRFKDEEGRVLSKAMETFFETPMSYVRPENGENISDILARTRDFWEELVNNSELQDKTVLISSHGCAVRALLQNVYQDAEHFWHGCVPPNCCVNVVEVRGGAASLLIEDRVYG